MKKLVLIFLTLVLCFALAQVPKVFCAESVELFLSLNPDTVNLLGKVKVTAELKLNEKPIFGEIVFFGVKGIKGSFTYESATAGTNGIATTTFTPMSVGNGIIIAKINIRIDSNIITVEKQAKLKVGDWNLPPKAFIDSITPEKPRAGKPATFFGFGKDNDGSVESWVWDMGDGTVYNGVGEYAEFDHTYQSTGSYKSTFQVFDNVDEPSEKVTKTIEVVENAPPEIGAIGLWAKKATINQEVIFQVDTFDFEGGLSKCVFDWGDGSSTTLEITGQRQKLSATYSYKDEGKFKINVKVFDEVGDYANCFEDGWEITVYKNAKGGIEISISGNSGRIFNLYGPLPSRKLARQIGCSEKGIYLDEGLAPGLYKVVDAKREFELRPEGFDKLFLVQPFEVSKYKARIWKPDVLYRIRINDDKPVLSVYLKEDDSLVEEPALALFNAEGVKLVKNKSSKQGIFEVPFIPDKIKGVALVDTQIFVSGVFVKNQIEIDLPLPKLNLGIESINDSFCLTIDTANTSDTIAVELDATASDSRTGVSCDIADVIDYLPQTTSSSRVPFEFLGCDAKSKCITIRGRFEVGSIEISKTLCTKSDIQSVKFDLDWGFDAINRVAILGNIYSMSPQQPGSNAYIEYKIFAPKEGYDENIFESLPRNCKISDNSLFQIVDLDNIQRLIRSDGVEIFVGFEYMGISFKKSFIVRKYDRWHSFMHDWNGNTLRFHITKTDGTRSSGAWVNLDYYKDGVKVAVPNQASFEGLPDAIRLSHNGFGQIDFGEIDTKGFSVVARSLVDSVPLLKIMKKN